MKKNLNNLVLNPLRVLLGHTIQTNIFALIKKKSSYQLTRIKYKYIQGVPEKRNDNFDDKTVKCGLIFKIFYTGSKQIT